MKVSRDSSESSLLKSRPGGKMSRRAQSEKIISMRDYKRKKKLNILRIIEPKISDLYESSRH
jgi:hypothetical protein